MSKIYIIIAVLTLTGCNIRERLDIGSAKAVKENQVKINEIIPVLQRVASTDAKFAAIMVQEFPDILSFKDIAKAHERSAVEAAAITKAKLDPYASLGELGSLIKKLNWLFSKEGLLWVIGAVATAMGLGGGGTIIKLLGKIKDQDEKIKQAHKADPNKPLD